MKFIFTLTLLCYGLFASAQRCATNDYASQQPFFRTFNGAPDKSNSGRDTLSNEVIIIPVVVHVVYNNETQNISEQQILSQIKSLNDDFRRRNADAVNTPDIFKSVAADTRIEFCLAKVDPNGRVTTGINRKYTKTKQFLADDEVKFTSKGGSDAWDATKYLNIWVCNLFGRTLGYAVLPGGPLERDGVVMKYNVFGTQGTVYAPYNKGRTATHEIGHWLGLQHLWGSGVCGDDGIYDTPPQQASNSGCSTFPHVSSCSINGYGDMFMNYMDFSDDACMNLFTIGQKNAMRSLFASGGFRNSLLNSNVCNAENAQGGPLPELPTEEEVENTLVKVYPNPFSDKVIISGLSEKDIIGKRIQIMSSTGKQFVSRIISAKQTTIELNHLPPGVYFVRIEGKGKPEIIKIVKVSR